MPSRARRLLSPRAARRTSALGRRDLLKLGAASLAASFFSPACDAPPDGCLERPASDKPLGPGQDWVRGARVAGLSVYGDASVCDVHAPLDRLADERVSVVEIDADLSLYLSDADFAQNLDTLDVIAKECHARGMRAVAYFPVLEVLTPNADQASTRTMLRDHPDWVQIFLDGKPNTFVGTGAGGLVFWVEKGEESTWMCPTSGYVPYYLARVEQLARATALDGLWCDVPLLSDIALDGVWPCVNASCRQKFTADTGLTLPASLPDDWPSWSNALFRKWCLWRHKLIRDLEQQIMARATAARSDFAVIIETVTLDYNGATLQGLDGAAADDGGIYRVWEVDAVSDGTAMRNAAADDWLSMATMMKHARAAAGAKPTWAFCYGSGADDAEYVMALAILAGVSPYETQIPELGTSAGHDFRKRMFSWLAAHPELAAATSANPVAVLFSSSSRDALYPYATGGSGLYSTTALPSGEDPQNWWSTTAADSTKKVTYVGEYRGACKSLAMARRTFDALTTAHADAGTLARYKTIVAPSPVAISAALASSLVAWVNAGGSLVVTGSDAGAFTDAGDPASPPSLLPALGLWPAPATWTQKKVGAGRVLFTPTRAGLAAMNGDTSIAVKLDTFVAPSSIAADAPESDMLLFDVRTLADGATLVVVANLTGLGATPGSFAPKDVSFNLSVPVKSASPTVTVSRPDQGDVTPKITVSGGIAQVPVTVHAVALVTVR